MASLHPSPFGSSAHLADLKHGDVPYSRPGTPYGGHPLQIGWLGLGAMGYYMARSKHINIVVA